MFDFLILIDIGCMLYFGKLWVTNSFLFILKNGFLWYGKTGSYVLTTGPLKLVP